MGHFTSVAPPTSAQAMGSFDWRWWLFLHTSKNWQIYRCCRWSRLGSFKWHDASFSQRWFGGDVSIHLHSRYCKLQSSLHRGPKPVLTLAGLYRLFVWIEVAIQLIYPSCMSYPYSQEEESLYHWMPLTTAKCQALEDSSLSRSILC